MPKQLATWNTARDAWEKPDTEGLTCGHLAVYSATFPTSGSMRSGEVFELPKWEAATHDSASSSLLKTPTQQLGVNGGSQHPDKRKAGGHGPTLADEVEHLLLPTVTTQDAANNGGPSQFKRNTPPLNTRVLMLPQPTVSDMSVDGKPAQLLPTPAACVANDGESTAAWLARRERVKLTAANGNGMGLPLTVASLLIHEGKSPSGAPMNPPSDDGNAPSADQLPGQLSLLDELEQSA